MFVPGHGRDEVVPDFGKEKPIFLRFKRGNIYLKSYPDPVLGPCYQHFIFSKDGDALALSDDGIYFLGEGRRVPQFMYELCSGVIWHRIRYRWYGLEIEGEVLRLAQKL